MLSCDWSREEARSGVSVAGRMPLPGRARLMEGVSCQSSEGAV
jgi:hypothetical protein